jgi:hypothetical protein
METERRQGPRIPFQHPKNHPPSYLRKLVLPHRAERGFPVSQASYLTLGPYLAKGVVEEQYDVHT